MIHYPSERVADAVEALSRLPGIGRKTALRLVLHMFRMRENDVERIGDAISRLRKETRRCQQCHNIADATLCSICASDRRDHGVICIVEDFKDVMAIENTQQFYGEYHILGGLINPMQGVAPSQLTIEHLLEKAGSPSVRELIFALPASIEGDTTTFYITRKLSRDDLTISSIARGIPIGSNLEYTDEITLARSIQNRTRLQAARTDSL